MSVQEQNPAHAFDGFDIPRQNWFKMPNYWTDITAEISSIAELKVVEYVLKHTWGYHEYGTGKRISNNEFMHGRRRKDGSRIDKGTGLSKKSVIAGLKKAVERGLLTEEVDDSDKARVKKYYALRMAPWVSDEMAAAPPDSPPDPEDSDENEGDKMGGGEKGNAGVYFLHPGGEKVYPRGVKSIPRTKKDTLERHLQQETTNNNNMSPVASALNENKQAVVVTLSSHGISSSVAQQLVQEYPTERIAEKVDFLEFELDVDSNAIRKPAAWLRRAIEKDYVAPDGFVSREERERQAKAEKERKQALSATASAQLAHIDAQQKAQQAKKTAKRKTLDAEYGTTAEHVGFWQDVLRELKFGMMLPDFALIADAEILQVTEEQVVVGIWSRAKYQDLQHPTHQKFIERAIVQVGGRPLGLSFVLLQEKEADEAVD